MKVVVLVLFVLATVFLTGCGTEATYPLYECIWDSDTTDNVRLRFEQSDSIETRIEFGDVIDGSIDGSVQIMGNIWYKHPVEIRFPLGYVKDVKVCVRIWENGSSEAIKIISSSLEMENEDRNFYFNFDSFDSFDNWYCQNNSAIFD